METVYNATILDLYKKFYNSFKEKHCMFICKAIQINRMSFTAVNKNQLKEHFLTQFPSETQYTEFYNNPLFNKYSLKIGAEWFIYEIGKGFTHCIETESFELRVKLLEAIIKDLEKKEPIYLHQQNKTLSLNNQIRKRL